MENTDLRNLQKCQLCDVITVIFPDYKVSAQFKIVKVTWNALTERYESMELGNLATSLAQALGLDQPKA